MEFFDEIITLIKYIFLGVFQGFTEPIPISSSGHVILLREIFNVEIPGLSFEIFLHFGSLIAIIVVYWKDLKKIAINSWTYITKRSEESKGDFHLLCMLVIATIPAGVAGLLLEDYISDLLNYTFMVGISLIITGIFLWIIRHKRGEKGDYDLSVRIALIIGLAQAVAIIPGISRSGATLIAAMLLGLKRDVALRFSFLLYIPVSLGATVLSVNDLVTDPYIKSLFIPYLLAFIAATITTYFALRWFINVMMRGNLKYFAYYCFIVGILTTIYFL